MTKLNIKALLFDNDGTLVDTEDAILTSFKYMMKKIFNEDNPDTDKYKSYIGLTLVDQFANYTDDPQQVKEMIRVYRAHNATVLDKLIKTYDGMPDVIKELKNRGYFLGVVTSKKHETCAEGLEHFDMLKYFEFIQGHDDWEVHKPDAGAITHPCEVLGFKPEEVAYIGDSPYDIHAGNAAGCTTCGVT